MAPFTVWLQGTVAGVVPGIKWEKEGRPLPGSLAALNPAKPLSCCFLGLDLSGKGKGEGCWVPEQWRKHNKSNLHYLNTCVLDIFLRHPFSLCISSQTCGLWPVTPVAVHYVCYLSRGVERPSVTLLSAYSHLLCECCFWTHQGLQLTSWVTHINVSVQILAENAVSASLFVVIVC